MPAFYYAYLTLIVHRGAVTEAAVAVNLVRAMPPTTVLVLLNMVQEDELKDEEEYEVPPFVLSVWDVLVGAWVRLVSSC